MYNFLDVLEIANKNDAENREKYVVTHILLLICSSRIYILLFIVPASIIMNKTLYFTVWSQ